MLNLNEMRKTAEDGRAETARLFAAANALRATDFYRYSKEAQEMAKKLHKQACDIEKLGETLGIFNEMEGWFCAK